MCHRAYVLFSWRRQSTARENTNPKIHVSSLSVIYGKRTRKRTDLKMRGKHAIEHVFRIAALSNISLPKLPRISTKFADAVVNFCHNGWRRAISHDYCHEGGLIYVSRDNSFHLSELSSGGTKISITSAIILFYPLLFFSSLSRFYEVHETGACGTRSLVHRINALLCKAVNFHTPLLHGSRNYAKYTAYQLDILRCYKTPFRVLARSF